MSIRERTWITSKGKMRKALIADFKDQTGRRVLQTLDGVKTLERHRYICPCCKQEIKNRKSMQ